MQCVRCSWATNFGTVLVYIVNFKWADLLQIEIRCRLNCVHKFLSCLTSVKSSRVRSRYSFQDALYA